MPFKFFLFVYVQSMSVWPASDAPRFSSYLSHEKVRKHLHICFHFVAAAGRLDLAKEGFDSDFYHIWAPSLRSSYFECLRNLKAVVSVSRLNFKDIYNLSSVSYSSDNRSEQWFYMCDKSLLQWNWGRSSWINKNHGYFIGKRLVNEIEGEALV